MGAVAEGLLLGQSAGAVEVLLAYLEWYSESIELLHVGDQFIDEGFHHAGLLLGGARVDPLNIPQFWRSCCISHSNNFFKILYDDSLQHRDYVLYDPPWAKPGPLGPC